MLRGVPFALILAVFHCGTVHAAAPSLVVLDIELTGDQGGPDLAAEHQLRIKKESAFMRMELAGTDRYRMVDEAGAESLIARLKGEYLYLHECNGCDLQIGRALNADQVLIPWVYRVSALILTLTYEIHDSKTGKILARKSFDFRGDNDAAWSHSIRFMVRHLVDPPAEDAAPSTP